MIKPKNCIASFLLKKTIWEEENEYRYICSKTGVNSSQSFKDKVQEGKYLLPLNHKAIKGIVFGASFLVFANQEDSAKTILKAIVMTIDDFDYYLMIRSNNDNKLKIKCVTKVIQEARGLYRKSFSQLDNIVTEIIGRLKEMSFVNYEFCTPAKPVYYKDLESKLF